MNLPTNNSVYLMDIEGESTGERYQGEFNFVCKLTLGQKRELELERSRLLASLSAPTIGLDNIATIVANLRVRISKAPDWWTKCHDGLDLLDENVAMLLFEKAMDAELAWETEVKKRLGKDKPAEQPKEGDSSVPTTP